MEKRWGKKGPPLGLRRLTEYCTIDWNPPSRCGVSRALIGGQREGGGLGVHPYTDAGLVTLLRFSSVGAFRYCYEL